MARRRPAFFYAWEFLALPALDLVVIAFAGPALGLLRAPVQTPVEDLAHMLGVISDAELPPDHLRYPFAGPQVCLPPVGRRALQQ